jgi:hypothetical protein
MNKRLIHKISLFFVVIFYTLNVFAGYKTNKDTTVISSKPITGNNIVQFVFTSDQHYGLTKTTFQGVTEVDAHIVNAALVAKLNTLANVTFPNDGGVKAGGLIKFIDCVVSTGDIANRAEKGVQAAAASWQQFYADYVTGITLKDSNNHKTPIYVVPGNHDVSNAIGYHKMMTPPTDPTSVIGMYNLMVSPTAPKTAATFNYATDKIHASKNIGGVHFIFLNLWPDSTERAWMENDLLTVSATTPVFLFAHSIPDVEARFFTNPNGAGDINSTDKFENLLSEVFKDGAKTISDKALIEQRAFANFVQLHPNIKAYFHGHNNYNQYYTWQGPDLNIALPCVRVDSPMKGAVSAKDETKLSFQVVAVDTLNKSITVRECLWNATPNNPTAPIVWGSNMTFSIQ